jgi:hypothetical protein
MGAPREQEVRERVAALNRDIARVNRAVAEGPPTTRPPPDAEAVVPQWR